MNDLLKQLTEAVGVSGDEREVRLLLRDLIEAHVDEWHVDAMGNLIALKKGTGERDLKVMVDAHMDEVGLIVTDVDSYGTFQFAKVGGIDDRTLLGKVVQVGRNKVVGVIGARPVHLLNSSQYNRVVAHREMRIDIGAKSKEAAKGKVKVGDRATFLTEYSEVGDHAIAKALDDRVGCALLVELLQGDPLPFDLYASFTVQEEVGLRGATAASYAINPDVALVLDCTPAYDLPHKADVSPNVRLGRGPAIYVMDRGTIQDPRLVSYLMQTAEKHDIPFQIRKPGGGGTNTASIQRSRGGVSSATISLPGRYLHAPHAMINLSDYAHMRALLVRALQNLTR